jgi:hypothetical protein
MSEGCLPHFPICPASLMAKAALPVQLSSRILELSNRRFQVAEFDGGRPQALTQLGKPLAEGLKRGGHVIELIHFLVGCWSFSPAVTSSSKSFSACSVKVVTARSSGLKAGLPSHPKQRLLPEQNCTFSRARTYQ